MSNHILFNKINTFHWMVLSFLLCSTVASAQLPIRQVNCDQLEVVIVPKTFSGSNDQASCTGCCSPYSCDRMEYDVFLVATQASPANLPSNGNFRLDYDELYIVLKLNRVDAVVTSINKAQTESCLLYELTYPVEISAGSYEANPGEDEVTLHISNDAGDATPYITFSNFTSAGYLFSIIVDAFPGEEFGINCELFTYVSASSCAGQDCTSTSTAVFPAPSTTNTNINIYLGGIDCNQEEYIVVPICDDFQFNMSTEDDFEDCSTLKFYAKLSWDPADFGMATSLDFEQLRAILSFEMDNGVSITDAELEGFSCPTSGNDPVTCPGSSCIDFSGNTVELCINVGTAITVNNNAQIVVTFNAPTGCVQSALIRKMVLKIEDGTVCQPDINPPSGFPYCSPMMAN